MEELKKRLTKKKHNMSQSSKEDESTYNHKYSILSEKSEYILILKLLKSKNLIIIKCSPKTELIMFEAKLELEQLEEKNRLFSVCNNTEDAYKIIMNVFNKKKIKIVKENNNSITLFLTIPNIIDNSEENISFNLIRKSKVNPGSSSVDINNNEFLNSILKKNDGMDFGLNLIEKINNLSRSDLEKDERIQKLIIYFNQTLEDLKKIKKDVNKIKNHLGIPDISENEEKEAEEKEEDMEEEEDENKINEDEENEKNEENEEEKEIEEIGNSDINNKEESRHKFNDIKEKKYQKKDDIENLKEKIAQTLIKINAKNSPKKSLDSKAKKNISKNKEQTQIKLNNSNNFTGPCPKFSFYKNIAKKTTSQFYGDNNFIVFESLNNQLILVYSVNRYSIHFYNIEEDKLIKNIIQAHKAQINNFRYARDKNFSRDLVLSVSNKNKNIKIWNFKNFECILNLENVYYDGFLFSSCFLIDEINNLNYIISVNFNSEHLKIFNFQGNIIRAIDNNQEKSYIVDTLYDSQKQKYYIIVGNEDYIISYNFEDGSIYKKYFDYASDSCVHKLFNICCKENDTRLVEADSFGYIRIWNFDTGSLFQKFLIGEGLKLIGICLWNEKYLLVGASDKTVKLVNLNNGDILDNLECNEEVCGIKKINSNKFGECLLLQGKSFNGQIKLWKNMNQSNKNI